MTGALREMTGCFSLRKENDMTRKTRKFLKRHDDTLCALLFAVFVSMVAVPFVILLIAQT